MPVNGTTFAIADVKFGLDPQEVRQDQYPRENTVREQLLTPYYIGRSLEAAIEALDPEVLVLLGPGSSLGGAIGQTLSRMRWRGVTSKASFAALQASDSPALVVAGQTMP